MSPLVTSMANRCEKRGYSLPPPGCILYNSKVVNDYCLFGIGVVVLCLFSFVCICVIVARVHIHSNLVNTGPLNMIGKNVGELKNSYNARFYFLVSEDNNSQPKLFLLYYTYLKNVKKKKISSWNT